VIRGDFDQINLHAVWVLDPHLDQSPGLGRWPSQNTHASLSQLLCLSANIPDLEPEHQRVSRRAATTPGHLQESLAQEEHHPWIIHRSELPVDRQTQHVAVEMAAPAEVGRAQQNPAAKYVHAAILAARSGRADRSRSPRKRGSGPGQGVGPDPARSGLPLAAARYVRPGQTSAEGVTRELSVPGTWNCQRTLKVIEGDSIATPPVAIGLAALVAWLLLLLGAGEAVRIRRERAAAGARIQGQAARFASMRSPGVST